MTAQEEAAELLAAIDEHGRGLEAEDITFVAGLIDGGITRFSGGDISRLRALHRRTVERPKPREDEDF